MGVPTANGKPLGKHLLPRFVITVVAALSGLKGHCPSKTATTLRSLGPGRTRSLRAVVAPFTRQREMLLDLAGSLSDEGGQGLESRFARKRFEIGIGGESRIVISVIDDLLQL